MKQILIIILLLILSANLYAQDSKYKNGDEIFIFYGAEWCNPCKQTKEILKDKDIVEYFKQSQKQYFYLDIDTNDQKSKQWIELAKVKTIPSIVRYRFKDNKWNEDGRIVGLSSKLLLLNFFKNEK